MEISRSSYLPLESSNLNISSDTGSDIVTLRHNDAVSEEDNQAQDEVVDAPPLIRRADRVFSVINCSASTCKKQYRPPPS